jgi:hypothetical protein
LYNRQRAMQKALEAMETALRVLAAINAKQDPDPGDVHALRAYAGPQPDGMSLDEFAREIIQKALKRRAEMRAAGSE